MSLRTSVATLVWQSPGFSGCHISRMSLRASAHTGVAIRNSCLPLGEGGSRVPRKRETDEGKNDASIVPKRSPMRVFLLSINISVLVPPEAMFLSRQEH